MIPPARASPLFPATPRDFPGRRAVRAAHTLTAGILLGGVVFGQTADALFPWLCGSAATGALLLATDLHASFAVLLELRGLVVVGKITLLLGAALAPSLAVPLLSAALVIGAVSSHMPGALRHRLLVSLLDDFHRHGYSSSQRNLPMRYAMTASMSSAEI